MIKMINNNKKRIAVAISGGVDSAVAALLLLQAGYQVIGIHMRHLDRASGSAAAKNVCKKLGIDIFDVDLRECFQKEIIDYFVGTYSSGQTPNPCVKCNQVIKFGRLWEEARKLKADILATGHYAWIKKDESSGLFSLHKASDHSKDQSYFLYALDQGQLSRSMFPLGALNKSTVRKIADDHQLPYIKTESQDICFLDKSGTRQFLNGRLKPHPGDIRTLSGKLVGRHQGLPLYTIGQRKGIEIGGTGPYYVVAKEGSTNTLLVADSAESFSLEKDYFYIDAAVWTGDKEPVWPLSAEVATRYRQEPVPGQVVKSEKGKYLIRLEKKIRAITSGQSAVFYAKDQVIGGGVIE